ncbi:hypothetical protein VPDG_00095 [Vibrio phage henriette 12B8]|uniref:hypothetical protein n=1 Tax=Vibrio phage henriette 12B8 TaxID=573174 RepID=UPI0002C1377F|nr:hypothetical protein VPDG_00095 [Vibrio phage henriette 12B8]AGG58256.1 hypothetical protein VPDG_00095 [Vibrio phage henriette 12B8]
MYSIQRLASMLTGGDVVAGCYYKILKAVHDGNLGEYDLNIDIYCNALSFLESCHAIKMIDSDDWIITNFGKDVVTRAENMEK